MKCKTIWYICMILILVGGILIDTFNGLIGIVVLGLASYLTGVYSVKKDWEELNEKNI